MFKAFGPCPVSDRALYCRKLCHVSGERIGRFLAVNAGLLGFCFSCQACAFCAAVFPDSKMGLGAGGGLCVVFILIQMLADGGQSGKLQYFTPLTLFARKALLPERGGSAGLCSDVCRRPCHLWCRNMGLFAGGIFGLKNAPAPVPDDLLAYCLNGLRIYWLTPRMLCLHRRI